MNITNLDPISLFLLPITLILQSKGVLILLFTVLMLKFKVMKPDNTRSQVTLGNVLKDRVVLLQRIKMGALLTMVSKVEKYVILNNCYNDIGQNDCK